MSFYMDVRTCELDLKLVNWIKKDVIEMSINTIYDIKFTSIFFNESINTSYFP